MLSRTSASGFGCGLLCSVTFTSTSRSSPTSTGPPTLSDAHAEQGIGGRSDELVAVGQAEIAALVRRARILRVLLGKCCEILARLELGEHVLGLLARGRVVLTERNQNVPAMALFRLV